MTTQNTTKGPGILEQIKAETNISTIQSLVKMALDFEFISNRTIRRIERAAANRTAYLGAKKPR